MAGAWLSMAAAVAAAAATSGPPGPPPAGVYAAQLCVTVAAQPPSCGPADATMAADGELTLRIHDIAYHLNFAPGLLVGITMHGNMQVAEFLSSYRWIGKTLLFGDKPRGVQYELQLSVAGQPTPTTAPAASSSDAGAR